jgi:hypothetical protein
VDEEGATLFEKPVPGFNNLQRVRLPGGRSSLMVTSETTDKFCLLNEKGEVEKGFPLKGSLHPVMTELHSNVILCGNRHGILYCYKTE